MSPQESAISEPTQTRCGVEWTGDLEDDCFARFDGVVCQCEVMFGFTMVYQVHEGETPEEPVESEHWFVGVYNGSEVVFHSGEYGGTIAGGELARGIAATIGQLSRRVKELEAQVEKLTPCCG